MFCFHFLFFFFSFKFGLRQKFGKASLHKAAWQRTRAGGGPPQHTEAWASPILSASSSCP